MYISGGVQVGERAAQGDWGLYRSGPKKPLSRCNIHQHYHHFKHEVSHENALMVMIVIWTMMIRSGFVRGWYKKTSISFLHGFYGDHCLSQLRTTNDQRVSSCTAGLSHSTFDILYLIFKVLCVQDLLCYIIYSMFEIKFLLSDTWYTKFNNQNYLKNHTISFKVIPNVDLVSYSLGC